MEYFLLLTIPNCLNLLRDQFVEMLQVCLRVANPRSGRDSKRRLINTTDRMSRTHPIQRFFVLRNDRASRNTDPKVLKSRDRTVVPNLHRITPNFGVQGAEDCLIRAFRDLSLSDRRGFQGCPRFSSDGVKPILHRLCVLIFGVQCEIFQNTRG